MYIGSDIARHLLTPDVVEFMAAHAEVARPNSGCSTCCIGAQFDLLHWSVEELPENGIRLLKVCKKDLFTGLQKAITFRGCSTLLLSRL